MKTKDELQGEIRYAIRLTQRTARLYRRLQALGIFVSVLGGSAAVASITGHVPSWIPIFGGILLAVTGAALLAIRPADKAAQNESDARRYQSLMLRSVTLDDEALAVALEETHQGDAPEIEILRDVAYNDVAREIGRPDAVVPLSFPQKFLEVLA